MQSIGGGEAPCLSGFDREALLPTPTLALHKDFERILTERYR
eukprot:SAG22_NODE_2_length_61565_cov_858.782010_16_plen_42_part_00